MRFVCWSVRHCGLSAGQSDTAVCLLVSQTLRFVYWSVRHSAVCLLVSQTQCGLSAKSVRHSVVCLLVSQTQCGFSTGQTLRFVCWSVRHCGLSAGQSDTVRFVWWSVRHCGLSAGQSDTLWFYLLVRQTDSSAVGWREHISNTEKQWYIAYLCVFWSGQLLRPLASRRPRGAGNPAHSESVGWHW